MNTYKYYLEKNSYNPKSINTYQRSRIRFEKWCITNGTTPETIDYKTFLEYIKHLRKGALKPITLKTYVSNLKIYFDYLVAENHRRQNIIKDLNIKGVQKTIIKNFLELEELYYSYNEKQSTLLAKKRNKIIIGLLVYQGLNTRDLQLLEVENIQLYKGKSPYQAPRKAIPETSS